MEISISLMSGLASLYRGLSAQRRARLVGVAILMFAGAAAELASLALLVQFLGLIAGGATISAPIETLLGHGAGKDLPLIGGLFCAAAIIAGVVRLSLVRATQRFVFGLGHDLGCTVYERALYRPYAAHLSENSSELLAGVGKVQVLVFQVINPVAQGATAFVLAAALFGGMVMASPAIALAAGLVLGLAYLAVSQLTKPALGRNSAVIAAAQTEKVQAVREGLGAIRDIIIDHAQPIHLARFASVDDGLRKAQAANTFMSTAPRFAIETAGLVIFAVVAMVLAERPGGLPAALPVLGALAVGAQRLLPLAQQIYNGWSQAAGGRQLLADVVRLLDLPPPPPAVEIAPLAFDKEIRLQGLRFAYTSGSAPVISDLDLLIPKGARVGFIGKTGAGKSTLIDLIMGLLRPTGGQVLVDGAPLEWSRMAAWHGQIAHVPQNIYLADTSIAENIAFGISAAQIDVERLREAARKADIAGFIESLPNGYQTDVGERGARLSGGQRQRIGLARAFYKHARLLVLDEATSALDDETEAAVVGSLAAVGRDLTIVTIAHRLTSLSNCDVIYRLDQGRIVARTTYAALLAERVEPGRGAAFARQG